MFAVAVFIFVGFQKSSISTTPPDNALPIATTTTWEDTPAQPQITQKTVITAKHAYRNGEHIIAGEIPLSTPCDILESSATASGDGKSVLVQLVSSIKTGESCPPSITPARFKVTAKAAKNATLSATLNGQEVTLNLIEAGPTENLDDFQLYIKG